MYGQKGQLYIQDGKAECHVCGHFFGHLGCHIVRSHAMTATEYRRQFGLNQTTGLIGPALAEKRRANVEHLRDYDGTEYLLAHHSRGREYRLETTIKFANSRRANMRVAHAAWLAKQHAGLLPISEHERQRLRAMGVGGRAKHLRLIQTNPEYREDWRQKVSIGRRKGLQFGGV